VLATAHGQRKISDLFFYGCIRDLDWDPGLLSCNNVTPSLDYTVQLGREILRNPHESLQIAATKWNLVLARDFKFLWVDVWEANLIW
jgi:hypothetical protein